MKPSMILLTAVASAAAPPSPPQGDFFAPLIAKADGINRANGFRATGWQHRATLRARGVEIVKLKLAGGNPVVIVGMCDDGCGNLDLDLLDPAGKSVDRDAEADDFPVVAADQGGGYSVRVSMRSCDTPGCAYLLRAYARP